MNQNITLCLINVNTILGQLKRKQKENVFIPYFIYENSVYQKKMFEDNINALNFLC